MYSDSKTKDQSPSERQPESNRKPEGYAHVVAVSNGNKRAGRFLRALGQVRLGCSDRDWAETYYCAAEPLSPLQDVRVFVRFTCDATAGWSHIERRTGTILPNGDIALDGRIITIKPLVGEIYVTMEVNEVTLLHHQPLKICLERGFQEQDGAATLDRICCAS